MKYDYYHTKQETVLLYNLQHTEKAKQLKLIFIRMGIKMKIITKEQYLEPIGFLAGLKELSSCNEMYEGEGFTEELLVMRGFTNQRMDELFRAIKQAKLESIALKAVLTETNLNWNSIELYKELKKEHEANRG